MSVRQEGGNNGGRVKGGGGGGGGERIKGNGRKEKEEKCVAVVLVLSQVKDLINMEAQSQPPPNTTSPLTHFSYSCPHLQH